MLEDLLGAIGRADAALFQWLRLHQTPALDPLMITTSAVTGGGRLWIGTALLLALVSPARARSAIHVILAISLSFVITDGLVKPVLNRARPFETHKNTTVLGHRPSTPSLPSGHAASSAGGAYALARMVPIAAPLFWGLALAVGMSRVYLGVHYPADVVAGLLLGLAVAVFVVGGTKWRVNRH